jgi:hypothetical protein
MRRAPTLQLRATLHASLPALAALIVSFDAGALPPLVRSWRINTSGATGYGGIVADVTLVRYSTANVYVSASGIPGYAIGPWPGNPNTPTNGNWVYKLALNPTANTGTPTAVGLGHVGIFVDGTAFYDTRDARSYNNQGIWQQVAWYFERTSFDSCLGHPSPQREWHPHATPSCLLGNIDPTRHSPLLGFAFDGYPIYGPYGYASADGTGGIARMTSSYRTRNITARTSLPNGTQLPPSQYGPAIGATFPLGCYVQDWEHVPNLGTLDDHNGRVCVTPEYPGGTYAYFLAVDAQHQPTYPYILGPTYYGVVTPGNTGPTGGHNVPPPDETVSQFCCTPCPADIDGSRSVDGLDLANLLANWGASRGGAGDIDRNGDVNGVDLSAILSAWGPCS